MVFLNCNEVKQAPENSHKCAIASIVRRTLRIAQTHEWFDAQRVRVFQHPRPRVTFCRLTWRDRESQYSIVIVRMAPEARGTFASARICGFCLRGASSGPRAFMQFASTRRRTGTFDSPGAVSTRAPAANQNHNPSKVWRRQQCTSIDAHS